ncbi:MAG: hypothetical protein WD512_13760 [Candidatus Paceibacterota bacterium]
MNSIRTNRILPAYQENICDHRKVEQYAEEMKQNDINTGHHGFPPIQGFYDVIDKDDVGKSFNLTSEDNEIQVTKKDIGTPVFRVTDGNHRFLAAVKAGIWTLETEDDNSGYVSYQK